MTSRLPRLGLLVGATLGLLGTGLIATGVLAGPLATRGSAVWVEPAAPASVTAEAFPTPLTTQQPKRFVLAPPSDPSTISGGSAWFFGWALLDRHTGQVSGSSNANGITNTMESMIKPWLAADYLRRLAEAGRKPTQRALDELTLMIVDSNDPLAAKYYSIGGSDSVVRRMASICQLKSVRIETTLWSFTLMSPADGARYGQCLADGRAAGPQWTPWLLETMRHVRGDVDDQLSGEVEGGRWGIIDGLPKELAEQVSIKNGWTLYKDGWHVNCLAIHPDWTLSVMIRTTRGLAAAAKVCATVASSLVVQAPDP